VAKEKNVTHCSPGVSIILLFAYPAVPSVMPCAKVTRQQRDHEDEEAHDHRNQWKLQG
jgi:hypothetical protein